MKKLKVFLLPAILLLGGLLLNTQPVAAQSQEEFEAELSQFASNHTYDEVIDYTSNRMASMTVQSYFEDYAELQFLGFFIGQSQCMIIKHQICDNAYLEKLLEITATSTVAVAACAIASGVITPPGAIICFAAVLVQHGARLRAASLAHKNCYLTARLECTVTAATCVVQQFIAARCDDYDYGSCVCVGGYNPSQLSWTFRATDLS